MNIVYYSSEDTIQDSAAFLASLAAFRALRFSSASFFFSSLESFFSNKQLSGSVAAGGAASFSLGLPGFVAGGAEPTANESGICAATPSAPPAQPSIRESHNIPSDMTPPTEVFFNVISPPSSSSTVDPTKAQAILDDDKIYKRWQGNVSAVPAGTTGNFAITVGDPSLPESFSDLRGCGYNRYRVGFVANIYHTLLEGLASFLVSTRLN